MKKIVRYLGFDESQKPQLVVHSEESSKKIQEHAALCGEWCFLMGERRGDSVLFSHGNTQDGYRYEWVEIFSLKGDNIDLSYLSEKQLRIYIGYLYLLNDIDVGYLTDEFKNW